MGIDEDRQLCAFGKPRLVHQHSGGLARLCGGSHRRDGALGVCRVGGRDLLAEGQAGPAGGRGEFVLVDDLLELEGRGVQQAGACGDEQEGRDEDAGVEVARKKG
ncbi:hypothetical protein [Nonomuraea sp. B19D2]|uniref:hypothetical protein n=1 Tax=Nonomuraea sp. B19D2 TaxID=3159561 RepID=UPI0032DAB12F